jgi:hypothetical protein
MAKSPVLKPFSLSLGTPTDWIGFVASASTILGILVSLPARFTGVLEKRDKRWYWMQSHFSLPAASQAEGKSSLNNQRRKSK